MNFEDFFSGLIELQYQPDVTKDIAGTYGGACIDKAMRQYKIYLRGLGACRQAETLVTDTMEGLLHGYFSARSKVDGTDPCDPQRWLMQAYEYAATCLILVCWDLGLRFDAQFVADWKGRTEAVRAMYPRGLFIVDAMNTDKPRPFNKSGNAEDAGFTDAPELPKELDTDRARLLFKKAEGAGLMEPDGNGYKWLRPYTNRLLAYFLGKVYCGDGTYIDNITKETWVKRGSGYFPELAVERCFDRKDIGTARLQLERLPKGHELVDSLFAD